MSGGTPENEEMKDAYGKDSEPFSQHSMAHAWKGGGPVLDSTDAAAGAIYVAWCQDCPFEGGWKGTPRPTREQAQTDADAHVASYPDHRVTVI